LGALFYLARQGKKRHVDQQERENPIKRRRRRRRNLKKMGWLPTGASINKRHVAIGTVLFCMIAMYVIVVSLNWGNIKPVRVSSAIPRDTDGVLVSLFGKTKLALDAPDAPSSTTTSETNSTLAPNFALAAVAVLN
jgi:hypothetical protein